jgi:hypothetical protein
LVKIQIIERLFYYINAYFYLALPLGYLLLRAKKGNTAILAAYGVTCCFFLNIYSLLSEPLVDIYLFCYTYIEYLFFTVLIASNIRNRRVIYFIVVASALFLVFQVISYQHSNLLRLDTMSIGIETILLFIYIILIFSEYLKHSKSTYIYSAPFFWLALGILIYLGGTFFFNILANHMSNRELVQYLKLTYVLEMIKTILFLVALRIYSVRYKSSSNHNSTIPYLDFDMN